MTVEYELPRPFKSFDKHGLAIGLPNLPTGDITGNPVRSRLYVYEDGKQIGESHNGISAVGAHGRGRFVHWDKTLYFSTPDDSNANDNGRRYSVVWSDELFFKERGNYFYNVLKNILEPAETKPQDLRGKTVLEIGCGRQHGMSLIMAGFGANVVAVDRYAPTWDDEFHAGFMNYLINQPPNSWQGFEGGRLKTLLQQRSFARDPFTFYSVDAETLHNHIQEKFDLQVSVAALEHFYDMDQVTSMLSQMAKLNCIGSHCIDLRDHRDFGRPLEFLLLSDSEYDELSGDEKYVHGNRWRPKELEQLWLKHGFHDVRIHVSDLADDYLLDFVPRLRASGTRFADESEDTLRQLSITYTMRRS